MRVQLELKMYHMWIFPFIKSSLDWPPQITPAVAKPKQFTRICYHPVSQGTHVLCVTWLINQLVVWLGSSKYTKMFLSQQLGQIESSNVSSVNIHAGQKLSRKVACMPMVVQQSIKRWQSSNKKKAITIYIYIYIYSGWQYINSLLRVWALWQRN